MHKMSRAQFVSTFLFSQNNPTVAFSNPLVGPDQALATWFHSHLTPFFVAILRGLSEPASGEWIGVALFLGVSFFAWKRLWPSLATLIIAVPGGMLLNELIKVLVQRPRPFVEGPFVDWGGYSFASGHTIGATLLYGQLLLFLLPILKSRRYRAVAIGLASVLVLLVGFSRIALGAHYLTDVLAAMFFGAFWLALCFFLFTPLRRVSLPGTLIPEVLIGAESVVAPVPLPVTEAQEPQQVLAA